ncbi:anthranilate synthase component II [Lunatimonas lonarensis]|uniref:Anthranilate synthase component II n=1 Tax=Lunatimonas lonarensis TaxID=1232681 RepID=R7ZTC1_9BACT|nr:aminodeoxychorismate/anthranilate synthase component II [Lunatimonas lonarensis]EON77278.1 anthranilate synthase component II [Lunatimonas lonarensis]
MILLIDNFDSFSYLLADYFLRTGVALCIRRNDVDVESLKQQKFAALVISPGPESPRKAGNLMDILAYYYDKLPVLGVCLGHQAIGQLFGAELVRSERPMHGKVSTIRRVNPHPVFDSLPDRFSVTRYHSLELKNLPDTLRVLYETDKKEIMAIGHRSLPLVGIQFHPEAYLSEYGEEIIRSWIRFHNLDT